MRGLRTQESEKFNKFFALIQEEAEKRNSVFFADCGQGDVFEDENFECENLCGWMIPVSEANEFEPLFMKDLNSQHDFDGFYCTVDYTVKDGNIKITIE